MSETIGIQFPDISGDTSGYTAFLRNAAGTLLNSGGDAITETGSTGFWTFTLAEARNENTDYYVRIYSGTTELGVNLQYDGILRSGHTLVDEEFNAENTTFIKGTVGGSPAPSTTAFTVSEISTTPGVANQFRNRLIVFDNTTTTAALRGQVSTISASSNASLPQLTFDALTTAPASGDKFRIV